MKLLLWLLLFVLCWPLALLALALYPFIWLRKGSSLAFCLKRRLF